MTQEKPRSLWTGEVGESLFHRPFTSMFVFRLRAPELLQSVEGMDDHRLLAIVVGLLVEDRIDNALGNFMPTYSRLVDTTESTFSLKIKLLEALNFIPPLITSVAHYLREVRNEFGHNLTIRIFEDMKDKHKSRMRSLHAHVYRHRKIPDAITLREMFDGLLFFCLIGLDCYSLNIKTLREELSDDYLKEVLERKLKERDDAITEEILSGTPISVDVQGNLRVERFGGGVVK